MARFLSDHISIALSCNETMCVTLKYLRIILINGIEGVDSWKFNSELSNKRRISTENADIASFNERYLAISTIISQERPTILQKLND